jgi:hypothetical protein
MEKYYNEMDNLEKDYQEIAKEQYERISQRDIEYTDFLCWILEQTNWDNQLNIIKGEEYERFMESDDKEDEMDFVMIESKDFYEEFKKITGINLLSDENFVSTKYIDNNSVDLIVKVNGINKRYIIDVV